MATIRAHEFISLDGVFESPGWTMQFGFDPKMGEAIGDITGSSDAILLGRKTHEMFAPAWRDRSAADDPGVPFFNDTEKIVVGGTSSEEWNNTTQFGPYAAEALRELKESREGGLYISGSGQLVRGLVADGLLDELHLFVFPIALGAGDRLFGDQESTYSLASSEVYDNGVVHLVLTPGRESA